MKKFIPQGVITALITQCSSGILGTTMPLHAPQIPKTELTYFPIAIIRWIEIHGTNTAKKDVLLQNCLFGTL
jgi:hypothetical protein